LVDIVSAAFTLLCLSRETPNTDAMHNSTAYCDLIYRICEVHFNAVLKAQWVKERYTQTLYRNLQ